MYVRVKLEGIDDEDRLGNIFHGNAQGRELTDNSPSLSVF